MATSMERTRANVWRSRLSRTTLTSLAMGLLGLLVLVLWLATNDGSTMSMLLLLMGASILAIAVLLYFFSPSRYLREDVCDAMIISDVLAMNSMLSSLLIVSRGIHVPANQGGAIRVFVPLSKADGDISALDPGFEVFNVSGPIKGLSLVPPGYGLFQHAVSIGATFTEEGLENEIKDVMENGMELASSVTVKRDGEHVFVSMKNIVNQAMCLSIRADDPGICARTGCPVCSFVACMIAAGTGKKTRMESVSVDGKTITANFELL